MNVIRRGLSVVASSMFLMAAVPAADPNPSTPPAERAPSVSDLEAKVKRLEKRIEELEGQLNNADRPNGQLRDLRDRMTRDFGSGIDDIFDQMRRQMEEDFGGFGGMPDPTLRPRTPALGQKPRLGVSLQPVSDDLKERFKNDAKDGAFVMDVMPGSAAEKAGVIVGDCITSISGKATADVRSIMDAIHEAPAGKLEIGLLRKGKETKIGVDLSSNADDWNQAPQIGGRWLRHGERDPKDSGNASSESKTELKAGALELNDELAKIMKLTDEQRTKMSEVLQKHTQAAADEIGADMQPRHLRGNGLSLGLGLDNKAVDRAIQKHVEESEAELKGTLSADQLSQWSEWRRTRNSVSFSHNMKSSSSTTGTARGDVGF